MMQGIGDGVVVLMSIVALVYGLYVSSLRKMPLYFVLSMATVACLLLGYIFDICDYIVNVSLPEGYLIGYLGSIGSFLFLLTASNLGIAALVSQNTANALPLNFGFYVARKGSFLLN